MWISRKQSLLSENHQDKNISPDKKFWDIFPQIFKQNHLREILMYRLFKNIYFKRILAWKIPLNGTMIIQNVLLWFYNNNFIIQKVSHHIKLQKPCPEKV